MKVTDILSAAARLAPIKDSTEGHVYRCAVYLNDGLYLPCVALHGLDGRVDLALRRFAETQADAALPSRKQRFGNGMRYRDIVATFVAAGNQLNWYDIDRIEDSRFALPPERLAEIRGETSMGWTQFVGVMHDGVEVPFGTTFRAEFFDMPAPYSARDVVKILPHETRPGKVYRERPFFDCYVEGLA